MEKNISERKRKENEIRNAIIYQSLRNNIICLNDNLNNNIHFSLKTKFLNASNIIKFNLLHRCLKTKYPEKTKVKIYDKDYDLTKDIDKKEFELYFKNIIYCCYRNNYPTQKNYKNNIEYNSDCGWGCMIRSSQMILAKAIYEILIHEKNNNVSSIFNTISLLIEYPFNYNETPNIYTKYKLKVEEILYQKNENNKNIKVNNIYNENNNNIITNNQAYNNEINNNISINNEIIKIYPPFSIKTICSIGEILNKSCGEWFSDVNMPHIFKIINKNFNVIDNLKIIPFLTNVIISKIIKKCFQEIKEDNLIEENYFLFNDKKYIFKNYGLIFISVRIGLNSIEKEYYNSIKNLFNCKECIGFTGGKNYSASYFIGYDDKNMLYLDPHFSKNSIIPPLNDSNIESYLDKSLFQLPFEKLQPAFTICFLFRDLNEFKDLYKFFNEYCIKDNPCFFVQDNESVFINYNEENDTTNDIINNQDDF